MLKAFKYFILLFFTTISLVTLSSCDDGPFQPNSEYTDSDDNDADNASSDIIGKWELINRLNWRKHNGQIYDISSDTGDNGKTWVYHFQKDGELIEYGYIENGNYDEQHGKWKTDDKKLNMSFGSEWEEWNIKTLTSSRLVITQLDKDGKNEYYYEYTFRKEK